MTKVHNYIHVHWTKVPEKVLIDYLVCENMIYWMIESRIYAKN